jgi:heme exporter protein A
MIFALMGGGLDGRVFYNSRPMTSLSVENLSVARGDRVLFSALCFSLEAGEALHLQGRNGAGKTSLLETLCGLRQPESGRITPPPEPGAFHWIGHRNALNQALSPRENLRFWCGLHGADARAADAALARVGLGRAADRACGRLSIGQKRRAALARLLVQPRRWWFLDEPLAGLDHEGCALFGEWLAAHLAGGGGAVLSSHQPLPQACRSLSLS